MSVTIFCHGRCTPNPGGYACWAWVMEDGPPDHAYLPYQQGYFPPAPGTTNNSAEYWAVLTALALCERDEIFTPTLYTSSQLVADQVNGDSRCRAAHLQPLLQRVHQMMEATHATLEWIPCEENELAVQLSLNAYREARQRDRSRRKPGSHPSHN